MIRIIYTMILLFVLAACTLSPAQTPDNLRATETSRQLTALPTRTFQPTSTSQPITSTPVPSETPTATSTPTPTLTPTATQTASPTPFPQDPKQTLGTPDWSDTFVNAANWYLFQDDHTKVELSDGDLVLTALNPDGWSGWALSWPQLKDFYLEATMTPGKCAGLDRYGLVFRAPDNNKGYLFGFTCDGNYALRSWDGERFTMVKIWTPSDKINNGPNQTNRLGLLAQEERLVMFANGHYLGEVEDDQYIKEGAFGLFVGSVNTDNFQVRAAEIAYWETPEP